MQNVFYGVKYSVSCLLHNFLPHRIFIFYRIFWKYILHVYPPLLIEAAIMKKEPTVVVDHTGWLSCK